MKTSHEWDNPRAAASTLLATLLGMLAIGIGTALVVQLAYSLGGQNIVGALQIGGVFMGAVVAAVWQLRRQARHR